MNISKKEELEWMEWIIKEHPDFFRDLDKLSNTELEIY